MIELVHKIRGCLALATGLFIVGGMAQAAGNDLPRRDTHVMYRLVAHGPDRATAIARMRVALSELVIQGIKTNIPLQQSNMLDQMFQVGGFNIHYLERRLAEARK